MPGSGYDARTRQYIDEVAVERAVGGQRTELNAAERTAAVLTLTRKGWSAARIAHQLATTHRTVTRDRGWLQDRGALPLPEQPTVLVPDRLIVSAYRAGASAEAIARRLGVTPIVIRKRLERAGQSRRKPWAWRGLPEEVAQAALELLR